MYKIICDACKKEISEKATEGGIFSVYKLEQVVDFKSGQMGSQAPNNSKYDLCGDCMKKTLEFITSITK